MTNSVVNGYSISIQVKRSVNCPVSEKTLEKYLKELRKSYNYSQEFVASHLNITRQTYSHYETGRISPPLNSLYNLAKLYNVPLDNFLEFSININNNADDDNTPGVECPAPDSLESRLADDDLDMFLQHISAPENSKKFKSLKRQEKLCLYYYQLLDDRDKEDIIAFMKIKCHNRRIEQKRNALLENE